MKMLTVKKKASQLCAISTPKAARPPFDGSAIRVTLARVSFAADYISQGPRPTTSLCGHVFVKLWFKQRLFVVRVNHCRSFQAPWNNTKNSFVFMVCLPITHVNCCNIYRNVSERMSTLYSTIVFYFRNTTYKIVTFIAFRITENSCCSAVRRMSAVFVRFVNIQQVGN